MQKSTGIPWHGIGLHNKGKVKICMYKYINKMQSELPTDMRSAKTPGASHLFSINPEAKKLPYATAQVFHHLVAKYIY